MIVILKVDVLVDVDAPTRVDVPRLEVGNRRRRNFCRLVLVLNGC
jgi:hypothetical protein